MKIAEIMTLSDMPLYDAKGRKYSPTFELHRENRGDYSVRYVLTWGKEFSLMVAKLSRLPKKHPVAQAAYRYLGY